MPLMYDKYTSLDQLEFSFKKVRTHLKYEILPSHSTYGLENIYSEYRATNLNKFTEKQHNCDQDLNEQ